MKRLLKMSFNCQRMRLFEFVGGDVMVEEKTEMKIGWWENWETETRSLKSGFIWRKSDKIKTFLKNELEKRNKKRLKLCYVFPFL